MTPEAELAMTLVHQGKLIINDMVMKLPPDDAHYAIGKLREHLEERAKQTTDVEDLL